MEQLRLYGETGLIASVPNATRQQIEASMFNRNALARAVKRSPRKEEPQEPKPRSQEQRELELLARKFTVGTDKQRREWLIDAGVTQISVLGAGILLTRDAEYQDIQAAYTTELSRLTDKYE
ncbi:MAG: hypothetical protein WCP89_01810 [archaeon]